MTCNHVRLQNTLQQRLSTRLKKAGFRPGQPDPPHIASNKAILRVILASVHFRTGRSLSFDDDPKIFDFDKWLEKHPGFKRLLEISNTDWRGEVGHICIGAACCIDEAACRTEMCSLLFEHIS